MSTGGESAYYGAYGDERTPAPDSTRGLMPPPPPSTATAAGVPADDLVTPAAAPEADKSPGLPGGPGGGGGGGGGRGDGGRRKFVDEGKAPEGFRSAVPGERRSRVGGGETVE